MGKQMMKHSRGATLLTYAFVGANGKWFDSCAIGEIGCQKDFYRSQKGLTYLLTRRRLTESLFDAGISHNKHKKLLGIIAN